MDRSLLAIATLWIASGANAAVLSSPKICYKPAVLCQSATFDDSSNEVTLTLSNWDHGFVSYAVNLPQPESVVRLGATSSPIWRANVATPLLADSDPQTFDIAWKDFVDAGIETTVEYSFTIDDQYTFDGFILSDSAVEYKKLGVVPFQSYVPSVTGKTAAVATRPIDYGNKMSAAATLGLLAMGLGWSRRRTPA